MSVWRRGKPRLSRRAAAEDDADADVDGEANEEDVADSVELEGVSLASLVDRLPYLFFRYRAHELRAAPSLSLPVLRSGDGSRDLRA